MPRRCAMLLGSNQHGGPCCPNRATRKRPFGYKDWVMWVCARCDRRHQRWQITNSQIKGTYIVNSLGG